MKYIEYIELVGVNTKLSSIDVGEAIFNGSIEAFSCKTGDQSEKKLYNSLDKELESLGQLQQQIQNNNNNSDNKKTNSINIAGSNGLQIKNQISYSLSPSTKESILSVSPFGPMTESCNRKIMIFIIQTLNASFLDYDFSDSKPHQFRYEPNFLMVKNSIDTSLLNVISDYNSELNERIWKSIDGIIEIEKSSIYSYIPEYPDPFTEDGIVWSFNYFWYNKSKKRIIFFRGKLTSKLENANLNMSGINDEILLDDDDGNGDDDDDEMDINNESVDNMEI